mgnify:CR=1 FL=1
MDNLYKVQVPRKISKHAVIDNKGRKWIRAEEADKTELESFVEWNVDEDYWYVWFPRGEVPIEGESIEFENVSYEVESVYHYKRVKRAIVVFSE